jgi:hypothetical protein
MRRKHRPGKHRGGQVCSGGLAEPAITGPPTPLGRSAGGSVATHAGAGTGGDLNTGLLGEIRLDLGELGPRDFLSSEFHRLISAVAARVRSELRRGAPKGGGSGGAGQARTGDGPGGWSGYAAGSPRITRKPSMEAASSLSAYSMAF